MIVISRLLYKYETNKETKNHEIRTNQTTS